MAITGNNTQIYSLYASLFNYNQWSTAVADLDRDWNTGYVMALIEGSNRGQSFGISGPEGKLITMIQPRQEVVQLISSTSQDGANLIINFADPTYNGFRNKDMVTDDPGNNKGQVISTAPGTITIQPTGNPATLTNGSQFVAGRYCVMLYDASGNFNSAGKTRLFKERVPRYNYSAVQRDSTQIARREKFNSFMSKSGVAYYWHDQEAQMLKRQMRAYVNKIIFSDPGVFNSTIEGATNQTEGLRAAIRNQGGQFVSSTAALSQATFESYFDFVASAYAAQSQDYWLLCGRAAWGRISSFYTNQLTYTVGTKMGNGTALNFDVPKITIKGITMNVLIASVFNDTEQWPATSNIPGITGTVKGNSFCIVNLTEVPATDGSGLISPMRKFHFASDPVSGNGDGRSNNEEQLYRIIPGMTGIGASNMTGPTVYNNYALTASSIDGAQGEVLMDNGIDFQADRWVWWEPAS